MQAINRILLTCVAAGLLGGCATKVNVKEVGTNLPSGTRVDGMPFRLGEPYIVRIYKNTPHGYVEIHHVRKVLPNPAV